MTEDYKRILRQLAEIRNMFFKKQRIDDLVNRKQALEILNISSKTLSNYIKDEIIKVDEYNVAGHQFFTKEQLYGISLKYKGVTIKREDKIFFIYGQAHFSIKEVRDAIDEKLQAAK